MPSNRTTVMVLFSLTLAAASIVFAPQPVWAFEEGASFLGLLCIAWVMASSTSQGQLTREASVLIWGVSIQMVSILLVVVAGLSDGITISPFELPTGHLHRRFFNHVQTVSILLLVWGMRLPMISGFTRATAWVGLSLNFAFLFYTGGRATLVAIFTGIAVACVVNRTATLPMLKNLAVGAVAGSLVYILTFLWAPVLFHVPPAVDIISRAADMGSVSSRFLLWHQAIEDVIAHPILGSGPMHFASVPGRETAHPHNMALQIAAEWGIPLAAILLTCVYLWLANLASRIRSLPSKTSSMAACSLAVSIAICMDAMFSGSVVMPVSQLWIATAVGLSLSSVETRADIARPPKWILCSIFVSQFFFLGIAASQLLDRWQRPRLYLSQDVLVKPRFWFNGVLYSLPTP